MKEFACVSFESADDPGQFLRHYNFELYLNTGNGGGAFAQDATFCPTTGNSETGRSFQSANYPTKYIRHDNYTAYVAGDSGSNAWDKASSWAAAFRETCDRSPEVSVFCLGRRLR